MFHLSKQCVNLIRKFEKDEKLKFLTRFQARGHVKIPCFFDKISILRIKKELKQLLHSNIQGSPHEIFMSNKQQLLMVTYADTSSDYIFDIARNNLFLKNVEDFLCDSVIPICTHFYGIPRHSISNEHFRQDHILFKGYFENERIAAFAIALDDITFSKGNVVISQYQEPYLFDHIMPNADCILYRMQESFCKPIEKVELLSGDCLLYDPLSPYKFSDNLSGNDLTIATFFFRTSSIKSALIRRNIAVKPGLSD